MIQPTFQFFPSQGEPPWTITADLAEISVNKEENNILLSLTNADIDRGDRGSGYIPGKREIPISLADFMGQHGSLRSASNLSLREIGPAKAKEKAHLDKLKQEMAAEASFAMMTGRSFELSQQVWSHQESRLRGAENNLTRLKIEPHRRWSNGFSCLCFVMIGAPMAVWLRHGEFWGSFFVCFLPILLVYYPLLVGCVDQAKSGVFPAEAVWLGNLVLAACGVWLMRRVIRF
jgi:lipopolysaccharide export system permease protein